MALEKNDNGSPINILNQEQEEVLDLYLQQLDDYHGAIKESDKMQVEIETLHLKRLLTK